MIDQYETENDIQESEMRQLQEKNDLYGDVIPKSFWTASDGTNALVQSLGRSDDKVVIRSTYGYFMRADSDYLYANR